MFASSTRTSRSGQAITASLTRPSIAERPGNRSVSDLPGDYYITDVKFINRDVGYVSGTRPFVAILAYRTTDGGQTWTALDSLPSHYVDFVDPNHGWLATIGGTGFRTIDGARTGRR